MDTTQYKKTPVDVLVRHSTSGKLKPTAILYEDGKTYEIEKITECFVAKTARTGDEMALRYTIQVQGQKTYLYEKNGIFFVEAKVRREQNCRT